MAQLRNLGMPFGSPGGIINIPAPAGSALAAQIQMQQLAGIGQALGMYFGQRRAGQLWNQGIQSLQNYDQNMQVARQAAIASGQSPDFNWPGSQPSFPNIQSRQLQRALEGQLGGQLGGIFGDPLEREYLRERIGATRALKEQRMAAEKTKIQELIEEGYNPAEAKHVLDIFHGLKPRASAAKSLEQKSLPEQLSFWQTVYNKTLDPEWGSMRPTEDMGAARELAKQNMDRITAGMRQSAQANGGLEADLQNALSAIESGAPRNQVYRRLIKAYPGRAAEIKRLLSTKK